MEDRRPIYRFGMAAAVVNICGILLSGPLGMGIEMAVKPSPPWDTPAAWAEQFHPVQVLPYAGELVMILSFLAMLAALHRLAEAEARTRTLVSLMLAAGFAPLAFFNNIAQTSYLPMLARHYNPAFDALIFTFSLANPNSFAWAIEMWAYALLGLAFWMAAAVFSRGGLERATRAAMTLTGVVSLFGGASAVLDVGWVWDTPGLLGYMGWNVVVLAQACLIWLGLRGRLVEQQALDALETGGTDRSAARDEILHSGDN